MRAGAGVGSWIAAARLGGNRSATRASAGQSRQWTRVTLPFTSLVLTTLGGDASALVPEALPLTNAETACHDGICGALDAAV